MPEKEWLNSVLEAPIWAKGILNDLEIAELCRERGMISPFGNKQQGRPSWGLGSFGYDIRLGEKFLVPKKGVNVVLDPTDFPREYFEEVTAKRTFEIPAGSQVLAESVEWFDIPEDVMALCLGKSSYARAGLLVNATPAEPQWRGRWTLELANLATCPIRLYVGQGIAQVLFFRGWHPERTYTEKEAGGTYQDQQGVTPPK